MATSLDGSIVTNYCDPIDVIKAIRLVDYYSPDGELLQPSDSSLPDWDELCFRITVAEKYIDRYTGRSWRENRVVKETQDINTYWHDENAWRTEYWLQGGYLVQLNKPVIEFDPSKGDKVELRSLDNSWIDISSGYMLRNGSRDVGDVQPSESDRRTYTEYNGRFWFDYDDGKMYLRCNNLQPKQNSIRLTYRWGDVAEVPPDIRRATALKVGLTMLQEELYLTKIGQGGDLGSNKSDMKRSMQDEINEIIYANRTFTSVFSAYD